MIIVSVLWLGFFTFIIFYLDVKKMHGSKVAHAVWRICTRSSTWMVWPIGLGPFNLFTYALVVGGGGGRWTWKYFAVVRLTSASTGLPGCGLKGGGDRTHLVDLFSVCVWDLETSS